MSEQKNGLGRMVLAAAAVGLLGLVGFDQLQRHTKAAAPKTAVAPQENLDVPDEVTSGAGLPVFIESDSVGRPTNRVAPPAPPDTTGHRDQLPPGEVMTI